ncbi:MAG: hypothetical protein F6J93_36625 [Oscillatoria sp. SIO1A7]|nr:hypothetical protein [Oscillatoria sp. SIO1A7]
MPWDLDWWLQLARTIASNNSLLLDSDRQFPAGSLVRSLLYSPEKRSLFASALDSYFIWQNCDRSLPQRSTAILFGKTAIAKKLIKLQQIQ